MVSVTAIRQRAAETASSVECVGIKKIPNPTSQTPTPNVGFRVCDLALGIWDSGVGFSLPAVAWSLVRSADARRADEQLLAVREGDVTAVRAVRTVLRLETLDDDLGALGQRVLVPAAAEQSVRCATFNHPALHLAVVALHVDVNPGMRIDPLHLDDSALHLDGLLRVELGRERVVRHNRSGSRDEQRGTGDNAEQFRTHRVSLLPRNVYVTAVPNRQFQAQRQYSPIAEPYSEVFFLRSP